MAKRRFTDGAEVSTEEPECKYWEWSDTVATYLVRQCLEYCAMYHPAGVGVTRFAEFDAAIAKATEAKDLNRIDEICIKYGRWMYRQAQKHFNAKRGDTCQEVQDQDARGTTSKGKSQTDSRKSSETSAVEATNTEMAQMPLTLSAPISGLNANEEKGPTPRPR